MITSVVNVRAGNYDVKIGHDLIQDVGKLTAAVHAPCRIGIITDDNVAPLYLSAVKASLTYAGFEPHSLVLPHGEHTKSMEYYSRLMETAAGWGLRRTDMLAALGGGVIGDLTGFTAATYMRGIDYIQIPTTLLAAIDSSVGGKTAIDLLAGKNLCGAFHQPRLVVCDIGTFSTLPDEVLSDGAAEAVKYGIIRDAALFRSLLGGKEGFDADYTVRRCVEIKADIVGRDEFDHGERKLLNYGHTIGHSVEKLSGYSITHGHAVAVGMYVIARAACAAGLCSPDVAHDTEKALLSWDLPTSCEWDYTTLAKAAVHDKKIEGEKISLLIPKRIGEAYIFDIPVGKLTDFIGAGEKS